MAEYAVMPSNYSPLDRAYSDRQGTPLTPEARADDALAQPIVPMRKLGQTVPEVDPRSGAHILQNVQAAIRTGTGNIQLVWSVRQGQAMGGGFKGYGPEAREQLRHMLEETGVALAGVELPTSMSNLSGFDPQQMTFSDEQRARDLQEVRDAIRFVAEVGKGGGVDVLSWEFVRPMTEMKFNQKIGTGENATWLFGNPGKNIEEQERTEFVQVVDPDTGKVQMIRKSQVQYLPFDPNKLDPSKPMEEWSRAHNEIDTDGLPKLREWTWQDFERVAERVNKGLPEGKKRMSPAEVMIKVQETGQLDTLEGWAGHHMAQAEDYARVARQSRQRWETMSAEEREQNRPLLEQAQHYEKQAEETKRLALGNKQQAEMLKKQMERITPIEK
jgi:hypothetical protein